jgi:excisionase family DNA binding protein
MPPEFVPSKEEQMDTKAQKQPSPIEDGSGEILNPDQLAQHLGIGRTYVYQILAENRIPNFTIGKLRRVRKVDVDRYVDGLLEDQRP